MKNRIPEPILKMITILAILLMVVALASFLRRRSGETLAEHAARQALQEQQSGAEIE